MCFLENKASWKTSLGHLFLVLCFLYGNSEKLKAQVFDPETKWYYCVAAFPPNDERCAVLGFGGPGIQNQDTLSLLFDTMYASLHVVQIGKKVWLDSVLNYDFGLSTGDSLELRHLQTETATYHVDSVGSAHLFGRERIIQFVSRDYFMMVLVEGIGAAAQLPGVGLDNLNYFLDPGMVWPNLVTDPGLFLSYVYDEYRLNGPLIYGQCYACTQLVPVNEESLSKQEFAISTMGKTVFLSGLSSPGLLQIYTVTGQLVFYTEIRESQMEIALPYCNAGIYYCKISQPTRGRTQSQSFVLLD